MQEKTKPNIILDAEKLIKKYVAKNGQVILATPQSIEVKVVKVCLFVYYVNFSNIFQQRQIAGH